MATILDSAEWRALQAHFETIAEAHLRDLFAADPERGTTLVVSAGDLYLDYSKHRLTAETIALLADVARRAGVEALRDAMFRGDRINVTEDRSVLHVALRMPRGAQLVVDGVDVVAEVQEVLDRMAAFANRVRSGEWTGHTGRRIEAVDVHVGVDALALGGGHAHLHGACGVSMA